MQDPYKGSPGFSRFTVVNLIGVETHPYTPRMTTTRRRAHVLIEPNATVAKKLRDAPNRWFLVGGGDLDYAKTLSQTAYRINRGRLEAFAKTPAGRFEASYTADTSRPNQVYPAELSCRWVPTESAAAPVEPLWPGGSALEQS